MTTATSPSKNPRLQLPQSRFRRRAALAALATMVAVPTLRATTDDWNFDSNLAGWGTAIYWLGGNIPNGVDDTANFLFDITGARTIALDGSRVLGTMSVGDPTATNFGYTFSANGQGGALIFETSVGNANLTFTAASGTAANVFNVPLQLNDSLNVHALNTAMQTFNGNISGAGGLFIDSSATHPSGTSSQVAQVTLTGFNTFSGGLTVTEAHLVASSPFTLGTGTVTVNDGGQVWLGGWDPLESTCRHASLSIL